MAGALFAAQAGLSIVNTAQQYQAAGMEGKFEQQQNNLNAGFSRLEAQDALRRGGLDAALARRRGVMVKGTQREALAGQNVDVGSGTPGALVEETGQVAEDDAQAIENDAWREAWGLRAKADSYEAAGRMAKLEARNKRRSTILTGGMSVLNAWSKTPGRTPARQFGSSSAINGGRPFDVAPESYTKGRY